MWFEKLRGLVKNSWRIALIGVLFTSLGVALIARAAYHQLYPIQQAFLQNAGDNRAIRTITISANRGMFLDRNGEPIAVSAPVISFWANPTILVNYEHYYKDIAESLDIPYAKFVSLIESRKDKKFVWLKRQLIPEQSRALLRLNIPGIHQEREYRRYYPDAEVTSHILGFTDIEDQGQDGLERTFNDLLQGKNGSKRVLRDQRDRIIEEIEIINEPLAGENITLTIDRRLQYLAYRALKTAVLENNATAGSLILADAKTGEILALVNQPAGNPNDRAQRKSELLKNRVVTDVFEPGSIIKPFVVATALETGLWRPHTMIETGSGAMPLGKHMIRDVGRNGLIDVTKAIVKSSNIAMVKISQTFPPQKLYDTYKSLGIGQKSGLKFTGEQAGYLGNVKAWNKNSFEYATKTFGYGITINTLQMAQMYAVLANDGVYKPLHIKKDKPLFDDTHRVMSQKTAHEVVTMLEAVVGKGGSGRRAAVPGFRVGGKSGTARKVINGHYSNSVHRAFFAGIAPISNPRYVLVIVIDEPSAGKYYGGLVGAPIFSEVMGGALRLLGVRPDEIPDLPKLKLISKEQSR
ncbi:cell division protein FtsI [Gammaproteobacteria bacterium]|nr:cell division protein FtsI [Gammaproteobacteria bacterium]